jgi:RNA polymerase sigma-70 factor, ECF subfamily
VPHHPDEIALLRRAQAGDSEAFTTLQGMVEGPMRRFVWRLVGTHPDEDDIVQDSMIAFYLNLGRIDPPEQWRAYAFRIVRNRCYDLLRRQRRFDPVSLDAEEAGTDLAAGVADGLDGPDEVAHWLLVQLEVQRALDQLPELQRQTVMLYAQEGMTLAEIAAVMGTTVGTAKSRLFYARQGLRRLVRPETMALLEGE